MVWDMSEISQSKQAFATGRWVWQTLGILLGTATMVSLIKHGFVIELSGLPAMVLQQYAWLRDMLFEPLVRVARFFGLSFPASLKDVIAAYALVAAAQYRSVRGLLMKIGQKPDQFRLELIWLAIAWPALHAMQVRHWYRPHLNTRVGVGEFFRAFLLSLLASVICTAAFFMWNHLANVYGPG